MLTIPLLLSVIFLCVIFLILYLIVYNDFNENDFANRAQVTLEYMKRTNAEHPLPEELSYVSAVNEHIFVVTTFKTSNFEVVKKSTHDDRLEIFNFLKQDFEKVSNAQVKTRIQPHPTRTDAFQILGDDGWITLECGQNKRYDHTLKSCTTVDFCDGKQPGNYGLTEELIDLYILNHNVVKNYENTANAIEYHPTMYIRCLANGSHVIEECPANHFYDSTENQCVLRNDCESRPDGYVLPIFSADLNNNEYFVCQNNKITVGQCGDDEIFDRRLLVCVKGDPCLVHGTGYTYITDNIGDNQYFQCISSSESELITCLNRVFVNNEYSCSGDAECASFVNGTGVTIRTYEDENVMFNTGILECDQYNSIKNIECNTENVLANKKFNEKFTVNIHVPAQIYDTTSNQCVDFDVDKFTIKSKYFSISSEGNDLNINYDTAMLGLADQLPRLLTTERLDDAVKYARDDNEVGLNPINGEGIKCFGETLYDIFEGTRLNLCTSQNEYIETVKLNSDQFIVSVTRSIKSVDDYHNACSNVLNDLGNFVKNDHFTVQILADILRSDVCGMIFSSIYDQYTTLSGSYTTIAPKYTFESVKSSNYIGKNDTKSFDIPISIPSNNPTKTDVKQSDIDIDPLFDPFERVETIQPLFNPFNEKSQTPVLNLIIENSQPDNLRDHDRTPSPPGTPIGPPEPLPTPPPAPPQLILSDKLVEFACFYSLPTFKFSACNIDDDNIKTYIKSMRNNFNVHPDCQAASGLVNIVNSYAYLGNGFGCKCVYEAGSLNINKEFNGPTFLNLETQSNDNIKYNTWIHKKNDQYIACPEDLLDKENFTCNIDDNVLFYLENLQI
ncbi:vp91 [Sucra jujuba nucleopolyhedrovirus]|uniref:Vp91 n=1 Tax=Sucra jujuba nucleopolyhedrovirus TaxID=1563660 RepID=A0A097P900_9ABAC|nr:vp91 [Sucra jujuba nucleopolyhedrovirus]AIU41310.1 vp91 [Sucra jujuba nucleopolyhedrovirus]